MSERKLFNEWIKYYEKHDVAIDQLQRAFMWQAWQASANREGYKLVPVEPTDHMKCVVRDFNPDIEDYANMDKSEWENLCSDIYKAMVGACDD